MNNLLLLALEAGLVAALIHSVQRRHATQPVEGHPLPQGTRCIARGRRGRAYYRAHEGTYDIWPYDTGPIIRGVCSYEIKHITR